MFPDALSEFQIIPTCLSPDHRKKGSAPPSLFPLHKKLYRMVTPQPPFLPPTGKSGECILTGFLSQPRNITDSQNKGKEEEEEDTNNSFHLLSCLYPGFRVCIMNSLLYCFSQHWYVPGIRKKILSSSSQRCATLLKKMTNLILPWFLRTKQFTTSFHFHQGSFVPFIYLFLQVSFISSTLLSRKQQPVSFTDLFLAIQTAWIQEQSPKS